MLKTIMKKNSRWVLLAGVCTIISSLTLVYAGYSLSFLFRAINYTDNALNKLLSDAAEVSLIWLVALVFLYIKNITNAQAMRKLRNDLRNHMALKIVDLDYQEFYKKDSGNYVSWLTSDVQQISQQAFSIFFKIVDNIATTVFSLIAMIKLNVYIGLTAIILFALLTFIPQVLGKLMIDVSKKQSEGQEKFVESVKETIMGHSIFRLYNLFSELNQRIQDSSNEIESISFQYNRKEAFVETSVAGINLIGQIVLLVVTLYLAIIKLTPVGAVLSVGNLAGSFFSGVGAVIGAVALLKAATPIFDKFKLDDKSLHAKVEIEKLDKIQLKDLSFSYTEVPVFENINAVFERGKKYALMGASGSGKSTLAKILIGFLLEYKGEILYDGIVLNEILPSSLYHHISYIDQSVYLFNGTIQSNIILGEKFSEQEITRALERSCLLEFVNSLPQGLDTIIEENGKNLSGGQRQRLALARAFIRNINFIIMDEGTSSLDNQNAIEIEKNLINSPDLCVIIITHHLKDSIREKLDGVYTI